jgi:hypothetical protein
MNTWIALLRWKRLDFILWKPWVVSLPLHVPVLLTWETTISFLLGVWWSTLGFEFGVLRCLSRCCTPWTTSLFCFSYFLGRVWSFCLGLALNLDPPDFSSQIAVSPHQALFPLLYNIITWSLRYMSLKKVLWLFLKLLRMEFYYGFLLSFFLRHGCLATSLWCYWKLVPSRRKLGYFITGAWIQDFALARLVLYHWTASPIPANKLLTGLHLDWQCKDQPIATC